MVENAGPILRPFVDFIFININSCIIFNNNNVENPHLSCMKHSVDVRLWILPFPSMGECNYKCRIVSAPNNRDKVQNA